MHLVMEGNLAPRFVYILKAVQAHLQSKMEEGMYCQGVKVGLWNYKQGGSVDLKICSTSGTHINIAY